MSLKERLSTTIKGRNNANSLWKIVSILGGFAFFLFLFGIFLAIAEYAESCKTKTLWSLFLCLCMFIIYRKVYKPSTHIGIKTALIDLAIGSSVGIVNLLLVFLCVTTTGTYRVMNICWNYPQIISNLSFYLLVAVSEEILCRGILLKEIAQQWSLSAGIIISSILFGAGHWLNDSATVFTTLILIMDGLMFAYAYKFHDSLWLPIGMHWSWNFFQGTVLGFNVSGTITSYSIIRPIIEGKDFITGGSFGIEGSIFMIPIEVLFIAFFYYLYRRNKVICR